MYGRAHLGPFWGYLAGWGFVVGKTASCAAMALTFGAYVAPELRRPLAIAAVVALTAVNGRGIRKTALLTRVLVTTVLASLVAVVAASLLGGSADSARLGTWASGGIGGTLESAGLLFFAFAGYARIATLGEEVIEPARTIPRAIPIALAITLVVYAVVATSALLAVGPEALARSTTPLSTAARSGSLDWLAPAVRIGGSVAALGVLLSLLAGVSRTAFAMAAVGDLPRALDVVHPQRRIPHRAELAVGAIVVVLVSVADLRGAIGFSSFAVLSYYAITNATALRLTAAQRRWPRPLAAAGLGGCALLALSLPASSVVLGSAVLATGAVAWLVRFSVRGADRRHP